MNSKENLLYVYTAYFLIYVYIFVEKWYTIVKTEIKGGICLFAKVSSMGISGINAFPVDVEIDISRGSPQFDIVGLPDAAVKESRERIRGALRACSIEFPVSSVMINLAPANTKKSGSVHDMAIFMAMLYAQHLIDVPPDNCAFIGEISLNGDTRHINGVLSMVMLAREMNIGSIFVPYDNVLEASVIDGIKVYGVKNAEELILHFRNQKLLSPCKRYIPPETSYDEHLDFSDVRGQESAKKALEIAAAGGHNVMLIGTPGCGKSMLAQRMPSILPPLTFEEALETTKIHSVMGLVTEEMPIITKRPFRDPHHTASEMGLVGGGTIPQPGEISMAHNGVLFLDEIAEFSRKTLEVLRQPLEDGKITISRVNGVCSYPCEFMLIGAMNPCPCGYYGHPTIKCKCSPKKIETYNSKLSGPLMERFDLHVEVAPLKYSDLTSKVRAESSADIRKRVIAAREIQKERFKGTSIKCNALITPDLIQTYCPIDEESDDFLRGIFEKLHFSGRVHSKILKVARTIADLEESEVIRKKHISAAVQYRTLDRN